MALDAVRARQVLLGERPDELGPATLLLAGGRVVGIEALDHPLPPGAEVLQVPDSAYVVPGVVDTHVHVNEPGRTHWEGFATATRAAALGGVTTLVDMPLNSVPPTTSLAGLVAKQAAAADRLQVDVGFWGGAVPGNLGDLEPLWHAGVFGFKCFLSPSGVEEFPPLDPAGFLAAAHEVARLGALLVVHAEDPAELDAAPHPPSRAYADFLLSRPDSSEVAAITRVVRAARETGARVHVLHLSSARALDALADARAEGLRITVETCPHYLCFEAGSIPDAAPEFKCCPPIRDAGNRDELWQALQAGVIDAVVSDHSPAPPEEKNRGGGDLQQAWGGISGLQVGFAAVLDEAARRGIGPARVSRWMSRHTADLVGLSTKGRITVGADADLAVLDITADVRVRASELAHRHPVSAYDGRRHRGGVVTTVLAGEVVDRTPGPGGAGPAPRGRRLVRAGSSPDRNTGETDVS